MKKKLVIVAVILVGSFQAMATCYQALNPDHVTVKTYLQKRLDKQEQGTKATLRLEEKNGVYSAQLTVIGETLQVQSVAKFSNEDQFRTSCAESEVYLSMAGDTIVIGQATSLTGRSSSAPNQDFSKCSPANDDAVIEMNDVVFQEIACE